MIDQNLIDQIEIPSLSAFQEHRQNALPSIEEARKALGRDEVTTDILKAGGEPVIR